HDRDLACLTRACHEERGEAEQCCGAGLYNSHAFLRISPRDICYSTHVGWTEVNHETFVANCTRSRSRAPCARLRPGTEESSRLSCLAEGIRWLHREISRGAEGQRFRRRRRHDPSAVHERRLYSRRGPIPRKGL